MTSSGRSPVMIQSQAVCNSPIGHQSRPPVPTRVTCVTRAGSQPCATASSCARRASNPQHPASRAGLSTRLEYEHIGAAIRCRPGSPALRGRGRSRARRRSWPSWPRTRKLRVQSPAGLPIPLMAIEYGRRDPNPHAASFELARSANCRHARVRRQGLEPRSPD